MLYILRFVALGLIALAINGTSRAARVRPKTQRIVMQHKAERRDTRRRPR